MNLKTAQQHWMFILLFLPLMALAAESLDAMKAKFKDPPIDCWPHTRWWWPGNPVSKEEITRELEQMRAVGIRGVEQITMSPVYERGGIPYMSDEFLEMARHAVVEAERLGMEISFNFGGPGWIIGGEWVPEKDKSKDMVPTFVDVEGGQMFDGPLPVNLTRTRRSWEIYKESLSGEEQLLAVVAGRLQNEKIQESSLVELTARVTNNQLHWQAPPGKWRIMCFWLAKNGHAHAVDHFSVEAMQRYCDYLGGRFKASFGEYFGKTVDSFFCDSFELPNLAGGIYWSDGLLEKFYQFKGYDLTPWLPAIWWDIGEKTPKIRCDVNEFLHDMGQKAFFETFLNWCQQNGVKGRIQPYGFTTDNIKAAGLAHIPEMEITPGEKDAADWFDTRIGPKKYVASGAHIYGRNVVSVEAFTFLHWERYRATMAEVKIAADGFLRSGANKFYNHGYSFLPEQDLAPSRRMPWAPQINPTNTWWEYYPLLTQYIARCSYILRQGDFAPDIAIYSPLANQWTLDVLNPRKWTREFDWGDLGFLLLSNGYDFDLLNDDALQNLAVFENGLIRIRNMRYKILLLPNIGALPVETMRAIARYVKAGGIVIALDRLPDSSTGLGNYKQNDQLVREMIQSLFDKNGSATRPGIKKFAAGQTYFIKKVIDRKIWWDQFSSVLDPFLNTIRDHVAPDFGIDLAQLGKRHNAGLCFLHRKLDNADLYFVANIQDQPVNYPVTFRVKGRAVTEWNPYTGETTPVFLYQENNVGTSLPLRLKPWQSTIFIFANDGNRAHAAKSNFHAVKFVNAAKVVALALDNGEHLLDVNVEGKHLNQVVNVDGIPAPLKISGAWRLELQSPHFPRMEKMLTNLTSWTDDKMTKYFSGTGVYEISFVMPDGYLANDHEMHLDLGRVGEIAEVNLNGHNCGVVWMPGQELDVTRAVKSGRNKLVVKVTNTNINRVSGFTDFVPVPDHLKERFGGGTAKQLPREFGFKPLPFSGLGGPVKISVLKRVIINLSE